MSHFVGLVFGSNVETLLEPYDENMEVEQYVRYTRMKPLMRLKPDTLITMSMPLSQQISIRILPPNGKRNSLKELIKSQRKGCLSHMKMPGKKLRTGDMKLMTKRT